MGRLTSGLGAAVLLAVVGFPALAQQFSPPPATSRNPVCLRLEAQLASVDRGTADPARAEQIRRYEDSASKQQIELDKIVGQSRRAGCQGMGFFSLFSGQSPQCGQMNNQIQQMRANLDQILATLQQLQGNTAGREGQRHSILAALGQNDCGPQYRTAAVPQQRGFFDTLFNPGGSIMAPATPLDPTQSSTFRTVCVRTCDGYYFPVSYTATQDRFAADEQTCQRMCPAADVQLYTHRNSGEDMTQAVSIHGQSYTDLPTAFQYRREVNKACTCKRAGQNWADAVKSTDDTTIEQGDIVVTEERAKQLSQPTPPAQGRRSTPAPTAPKPATASTATPAQTAETGQKRQVRSVGPTFVAPR